MSISFLQHLAVRCNPRNREAVIADLIQVYSGKLGRSMVFCETKREADELSASSCINQDAHVLHGDIPQAKREMVLKVWEARNVF
jgi:ATP-dependent RNA helicase DDX21